MKYVDGYVLPIPKKSLADYRRIARMACKVYMDHGALEYRECVGEDLSVKMGVSFPKTLQIKPSETVVFSWITFKSRAHRDRINAAVMQDPRMAKMIADSKTMPFDCKRMVCGGFQVLVDA